MINKQRGDPCSPTKVFYYSPKVTFYEDDMPPSLLGFDQRPGKRRYLSPPVRVDIRFYEEEILA
jgi:hypothetical protein